MNYEKSRRIPLLNRIQHQMIWRSAGRVARSRGMTTRAIVLASIVATAPALYSTATPASPPISHLGSGSNEVWILRPPGKIATIIVFGHGWSTPFPSGFGAWVRHLRERGNLVVYPRYRTDAYETTTSALTAFRHGVSAALRNIGPIRVPVVAVGKSFGGSAVFYYAAEAVHWGIPTPAAVLSIFPALPIGDLPARPLPPRTWVQILVGDRDTTAGSAGANAFWHWLGPHPSERKLYLVIHSRPGFVANHDSPQKTDPITRSIFWARLDRLIARVRHTTR